MRLSVRWLDVCPGEEKRILRLRCDGKAHSVLGVSRKDVLWLQTLTGSITMVRGNLPEAGSRDSIAKVTMAAVLDGLVKGTVDK